MSSYDSLSDLVETYLKVVHALITVQVANKKIYIEDTKRGHYHFRANDFKKVLAETATQRVKPEDYMKKFRTLQFIICETNRFTNSRYINGKSTRVITVDIEKYVLLKDMIGQ